jgi:antitoxin component of RelBE/YafQ-DinJ toxin-antitoxin module
MPKEAAVNIRLDEATDAELERVASTMGTTKSSLIRMLTRTFVEQSRARDFVLPLKWKRLLEEPDGRSGNYAVAEHSPGATIAGRDINFSRGASQRGDVPYKRRRAKK